jgi:cbb3-type cytochrome oxidase subunit 1
VAAAAIETRKTAPTSEGVVATHILVSTLFLGLAGILYVLSLASAAFPSALTGVISYGRLRPATMAAAMLGWLTVSFVGGAYYLLPRLTGARLQRSDLARLGMWAFVALTLIGMVLSFLGLGDGLEPFGFPWWIDLLILLTLLVPLFVAVQTVRQRTEEGVYVSLWFILAGLVWLPMLYAVGAIPRLASIGRLLQEVTFGGGFGTLWVTTMGVGLAYYTVVKATGNPLANRQLARVGFWSLAFAATWSGPIQVVFGPTPDWLDSVSAVLTLALPVAAIANLVAVATTAGDQLGDLRDRPELAATIAGLTFAVVVAVATSIAGFRSAATLVGFTSYWDGILAGVLFGVGGLLVAGWTHQALPAVTGRVPDSGAHARRHLRLTVWGVGSTMLLMMAGGLVTGFGWTGGGYGQKPATGENWSIVSGAGETISSLALVGALIALLGQFFFVLSVYRTVTSGRASEQEVLVPATPERLT